MNNKFIRNNLVAFILIRGTHSWETCINWKSFELSKVWLFDIATFWYYIIIMFNPKFYNSLIKMNNNKERCKELFGPVWDQTQDLSLHRHACRPLHYDVLTHVCLALPNWVSIFVSLPSSCKKLKDLFHFFLCLCDH